VRSRPIVTFLGAAGVLAALVLTGCAPQGAGAYGSGRQPDYTNVTAPAAPPAEPSETPVPPAPPVNLTDTLVSATIPRMGSVVTDQNGWVLYRFDMDGANPPKSNCNGKCAEIWPPAYTDGNPTLRGVPAGKVGTVVRSDGTRQLTIGNWPVYRYAGDLKPGQWKGQNVNGTWFVVTADGKKNLTCVPTPPPTPVAPPGGGNTATPSSGGY
jgi:predicted lipoprotein with Yx(FWY)xxD motif